MTYSTFHAAVLGLPAATFEVKFDDRRTYCVGGKMFAMAGTLGESLPLYGFKTNPVTFELLIDEDIARPMPYLQRAHWIELLRNDALGDEALMAYVAQAHTIIAAKLTRAVRASLGLSSV